MRVVGIDLAGPRNIKDTCVTVFEEASNKLNFAEAIEGADDQKIFTTITNLEKGEQIVIGIDAPLSYNPGGGDRKSDQELRRQVSLNGGGVGVMTPTMTRMVYLTLHGIFLARILETLGQRVCPRIVETHPGACMLLRGAIAEDVTRFKRNMQARLNLINWLETQGLNGLPRTENIADHFVASCASALGAWQWSLGKPIWLHSAELPIHPYDFAC
jgi:predicted nuclease with RNAse H fold